MKLSIYERRVLAILAIAAFFLLVAAVWLDRRSELQLSIVSAEESK